VPAGSTRSPARLIPPAPGEAVPRCLSFSGDDPVESRGRGHCVKTLRCPRRVFLPVIAGEAQSSLSMAS
jgi:hypothetical protein